MDLSVLIAARNEEWLARTIEDVLQKRKGQTEVIAVLDGAWADPPIPDHPDVHLIYKPQSIGQRAAVNLAAKMSEATYVMKLDAHCIVDEGFDVKLMQADRELDRPDITQIPAMLNLHAFNRVCPSCGVTIYQGPMTGPCKGEKGEGCGQVVTFKRDVVWQPRWSRRTEFWRFDHELHFQYDNQQKKRPESKGELVDVMSSVGASFFMRRARFHEIGGLDEAHGSWGQFGTEIACKSWLSGGRHLVNKRTWFSHLFRTQGDFGFPYPMSGQAQDKARARSRELWLENAWPGQTKPLSWLVEKFSPIVGWHLPEPKNDQAKQREERLAYVQAKGSVFDAEANRPTSVAAPERRIRAARGGLVYYSDCRGDQTLLAAVRSWIDKAKGDKPLVSVTLSPLAFGQNIHLPLERGQLTMFRQILAGLEALDTEYAFLVEHDVLYHPSYFDFIPPTKDRFYYNEHRYQVDVTTGRAVHYRCCQTAQLCASRELLVTHYRKRIAAVEQSGYERNMGYEPGTNSWARSLDGVEHATWWSAVPNIDLRTGKNLSKTRWSREEFRNKSTCQGWTEVEEIPGWGSPKGRFPDWLREVTA